MSSFYVYQTGSWFLILNPTKNIVQQAGSALLNHKKKDLIVVFLSGSEFPILNLIKNIVFAIHLASHLK